MGFRVCGRCAGRGTAGPLLGKRLPGRRIPACGGAIELVAVGLRGADLRTARASRRRVLRAPLPGARELEREARAAALRSEEHTSELQSLRHTVCRLLLEKN